MPKARDLPVRPQLDSWSAALAYALTLLDSVPLSHDLTEVRFGAFADGTGHWVDLVMTYCLGNTVRASRAPDRELRFAERINLVTAAWTVAQHPKEDGING